MRVLAITVGGTPEPIMTSLKHHGPDFTLFFVTDQPRGGSNRLLSENPQGGPGIIAASRLRDACYRALVLPHPDDFASCYRIIRDALRSARTGFPDADLVADYTGGTKTMTAAMAAAATRLGWKLSPVEAPRGNLNRAHLVGVPVLQSVSPLVLDEIVEQVKLLFEARNYEGAEAVLTEGIRQLALEPDQRASLVRAVNVFRGLARWDQFGYTDAYAHLRACGEVCGEILPHLARLEEFARSGDCPPYELVADLAANADGRAAQGRYEDAVLRLYRAVELLAQVRLALAHGLDTGDLDLDKVPEPLRRKLAPRDGGKATAGLVNAYLILAALGDPLGHVYQSDGWDKRLRELLLLRNNAFIEHGFRPLGEEEWQKARRIAREFLGKGAESIGVRMVFPSPPTWDRVAALLPT